MIKLSSFKKDFPSAAFCKKNGAGFTLVEVLVGVFLILIVFLGIFAAYRLGLKVVSQSKNRIVATALANEEIEKIRNLPYESIGVVGGFPEGVLEAIAIRTINNKEYTIEIRIDYQVDSADGIAFPEDECPNDYKKVEVKVSWSGVSEGEIRLVTDIAPETLAQECNIAGGILLISVFNAYGMAVSLPSIEIKNPENDETIKTATPAEGEHFFSLAPSDYKVVVSKPGYSVARTYGIEEVANPEKPHLLVLEKELTEASFSIDEVSSFSVDTLLSWGMDYFLDSFLNVNKVSELSNIEISEGKAVLAKIDSKYKSSGFLISTDIIPTELINWDEFSFADSNPEETQILYQILYLSGENWVLVPDADLPGNSIGFEDFSVDLSGLNVATYSQLRIKANFSTANTAVTPALYNWQASWRISEATPIAGASFHLQGEKIIGLDGETEPVYKYSQDHISGGGGHVNISDLEWDNYTFFLNPDTGLDLKYIEPSPQPIGLGPNVTLPIILYLEAQNSLLVTIQDINTGELIFTAGVRLYNSGLGYDNIQYTNGTGQTYFIPLEATNYTIEVEALGYSNYSGTVLVSGDKTKVISLERIE